MTDERPPDQPSIEDLTPLLRINKLCDQFRRAWKEGERPKLEDYLTLVSEGTRESLLRNLLPIDIEARRRKTKESPSSDEYIKRFPGHARLIRQAFFESTMASFHHEVSTPSVAATVSLIPVAKRLGDYELLGVLGKGGFGVVYEARHVKLGDRVALKTLPLEAESLDLHTPATEQQKRKTGDRLMRFKREFRMLADMNHPNLVGLHSLEADGDQWFFTMDLIEGTDFIDFVRPGGEFDEGRLRAALPQLVAGVMALHSRNVIHRDLKPSNVMVTKGGHVLILDFGLVAELEKRSDSASLVGFVGTPDYAAPEQMLGKYTSASDWYAVGTILYEALTGNRPYRGFGVQVLREKQDVDAAPISRWKGIPEAFANLAMEMLSRDPEARPDALEITQGVAGSDSREAPLATRSAGPLVGRESHLRQLQSALNEVESTGRAHCVMVSGRSGEGKTSLVEHFLEPLRKDRDFIILSGRCYDQESVPFKAIDGVMDSLCSYLQRLPGEDAALLLPDDMAFVVQLFPVLNRIEVVARAELPSVKHLDRVQVQNRSFNALRLLLARISKKKQLVIFADDLQWGDAESAQALWSVLGGETGTSALLIGTYRTDEASDSRFLSAWDKFANQSDREIKSSRSALSPLSVRQATELTIDRLGRDNNLIRKRAAAFHTSTGGNPYLLVELIGCFDVDSDSFASLSLPALLERKFSQLPSDAERVLEVIAVAGKSIPLDEAFSAAGQASVNSGTIARMRAEKLVRWIGAEQEARIDTYHDKIRETVLDNMDGGLRQELHTAIGEVIERAEASDGYALFEELNSGGSPLIEKVNRVYDLAYHFDSAGNKSKAFAYLLLAAEKAVNQFALANAINHYLSADRYSKPLGKELRFRVTSGLGTARLLVGDYESAEQTLRAALSLATSRQESITVNSQLAEITYKTRSVHESISAYVQLLNKLGVRVPQNLIGAACGAVGAALRDRLNLRWLRRSKEEPTWEALLAMKLLCQLAPPCWFRDPAKGIWAVYHAYYLAKRFDIKSCQSTAQGYKGLALGWYMCLDKLSRKGLMKAARLAREVDDLALEAQAAYLRAASMGSLGHFEEAVDFANKSLQLYTQMGDIWRINYSKFFILLMQSRLGNVDECIRLCVESFESAIKLGQNRLAQQLLEPWATVTMGNFPYDGLTECFDKVEDDHASMIQRLVAESSWHRRGGRTELALEAANSAVARIKLLWRTFTYVSIAYPNLAETLRLRADDLETNDSRAVAKLRRQSYRAAKHAVRVQFLTRMDRPYALRELAFALDSLGKSGRAIRQARKSCQVAEQQGARFELAKSRLVVAELSKKQNLADANRLLAEAKEGMVEFEQMIEANAAMWERKDVDD